MNDIYIENAVENILKEKSGWTNNLLWKLRKKSKRKFWKNTLDYVVIGGMTAEEQDYISHIIGKSAEKLTKKNSLFYIGLTTSISSFPIITNFILNNTLNYKSEHGIYGGLMAISMSIIVNGFRYSYAHIKEKGIESFSIPAIVGNSSTYAKRTKRIEFILSSLNYPEFNKKNLEENWEYMKSVDKKHDNIGFL